MGDALAPIAKVEVAAVTTHGSRPVPAIVDPAAGFGRPIVVPALVADVGPRAAKRFANFFGSIANDNTRVAYQRACQNFFAWCDAAGLDELAAMRMTQLYDRTTRSRSMRSSGSRFERSLKFATHLPSRQPSTRSSPNARTGAAQVICQLVCERLRFRDVARLEVRRRYLHPKIMILDHTRAEVAHQCQHRADWAAGGDEMNALHEFTALFYSQRLHRRQIAFPIAVANHHGGELLSAENRPSEVGL
jgi:hypothetical protein